jgi:glyoxylase-like metal-dependent hydrolase (beta-lactamase superfamily II)
MEERHFGPVWFLPGENKGRYPNCNSVFINGPDILIDPSAERRRLEQIRDEHGVSEIWLSHVHEDHIKYLSLFGDHPLAISEKDAPAITDIEMLLDSYGAEGDIRMYWRNYIREDFNFQSRRVSHFLKPGEVINLGTVTVDVIPAPGHTPGNVAFYFREPEVLFLGDYDLTKFGPWYGDLKSSIKDTISTINLLRSKQAKVFLTSHEMGALEKPSNRMWEDYLNVIAVREEKLLQLLDEPRSLEEIVGACIVYWSPRDPKGFFELGERGHMVKHLEKLIDEHLVVQEGEKFVRL